MTPPAPSPDEPLVLYIGGSGRSGSTLLERLLGAVPGVATLGEVVHLPTRGLVEGQACGCGEILTECPFWRPVGQRAFGGWDQLDGAEWQALQHRVDRNRHLLRLARPGSGSFGRDLAEHLDHLTRLYRAAAAEAGASILVDSSKHASTAFALTHLPLRVHVAHIVRDPRGVAYSWTKEVARPETDDGTLMPTYSPASAALWWDAFNVMLAGLRATGTSRSLVRYEDLLADPRRHLSRILAPTGLALGPGWDDFLTPEGAVLGRSHSVAGNPMRFRTGTIALRRDDAWRTELPRRDRRVVTALAAPFLVPYGYLAPARRATPSGQSDR